ncbi:MAG TPA: UDP-N-acetylmuramate dehydrogenase, partial [bacterium]|nr:UDP-N-acetylmuramate dehydrogenase [bacterium]HPP08569.1 UDP-N-acetylmuramate dehydrogenase [bacterium]
MKIFIDKNTLMKIFKDRVLFDVSAKSLTSFKTGGILPVVVFPSNKQEIEFLLSLEKNGIPVKFLGAGSNVLVSDYGFDGIIASTKNFSGVEYQDGVLNTLAGTRTNSVIGYCIKNQLTGLEFLAGIPGSIGGCLIMNAGTKNKSISDVVGVVEYINHDGEWINEKKENLLWKYRYSQIKEKSFFISSCTLKVEDGDADIIKQTIANIMQKRKTSQPLEYPSAGSVFKNPSGHYAGRLIEQTGLKGFRIGDAVVSEKHANFIVNLGKATSSDIWKIICHIQETVKK